MYFGDALKYMKIGRKVARPHWEGYWAWDSQKGTIMMHLKEGPVIDIFESQRKEYTLSNIAADDFRILPDDYEIPCMRRNAMIITSTDRLSEEEVMTIRSRVTKWLTAQGYTVCNESVPEYDPEVASDIHNPLFHLSDAIKVMSHCDAVYFCKGWNLNRECLLEHEIAHLYGLKVLYEEDIIK